MTPQLLIGLLIGVILGIALSALYVRVFRTRRTSSPSDSSEFSRLLGGSPSRSEAPLAALRQNLRVKCMHNEELMERLIDAERQRNPGGSQETLLQAAIDRWERDNR